MRKIPKPTINTKKPPNQIYLPSLRKNQAKKKKTKNKNKHTRKKKKKSAHQSYLCDAVLRDDVVPGHILLRVVMVLHGNLRVLIAAWKVRKEGERMTHPKKLLKKRKKTMQK
jgi:hypothetical protein